jgi:DinB superfamily
MPGKTGSAERRATKQKSAENRLLIDKIHPGDLMNNSKMITMQTGALPKEELLAALKNMVLELMQVLNGFDGQNINTVPFEGSWTAAQVVDHITRSNMSITKAFTLKGATLNRDPAERVQELKNVFLNFNSKFQSPDFILPTQQVYEKKMLVALLNRSVDKIKEVSCRADLSEMINHPAFGDITKFEILHFVLFHTQRHIHQLKKIFQSVSGK